MAGISMGGFSGFDTASIVDALSAIERQKVTKAKAAKTRLQAADTAWAGIQTKLSALSNSAADLAARSRLMANVTSSSDVEKVKVSGAAGLGSLSFGVSQLASSSVSAVSGFSSGSSEVGPGAVTFNMGLSPLGIVSASAPSGDHAIAVTQASGKAAVSSAAVSSLVLNAPRAMLVTWDGPSGSSSQSVTLAAGTYATAADVASALSAQMPAAAGVSVTAAGSAVQVTNTSGEGSAFSVRVSGAAATTLGFSSSPVAGTDAVVDVDGVSTVLTSVSAGAVLSASAPSGAVSLTVGPGGHLSVGSGSSRALVLPSGASVQDVATKVSAGSFGVSAAVMGALGSTQLVFTSKDSGSGAAVQVDWTGFSSGSVSQLREGQDAVLTLGTQSLTRSSNTITDLLPGATLTLLGTTSSDVTVSTQLDTDALAGRVKGFVSALNDALAALDTATRSNPSDTSRNGPLVSDASARTLRRSLMSSVTSQLDSGTYRSLAEIGVSVSRTGLFSFNESAFSKAVEADSEAVAAVLARGVSSADSRVAFSTASASTPTGSYAVSVTAAATRAQVTGSVFTQLAASEQLTVTSGSLSASFTAATGMTPSDVAAGLTAAMRNAGMSVFAEVSGGAVRVGSVAFGSSQTLSVTSTGAATGLGGLSSSGTDVAGSIAGVAASGTGQVLTVASGSAAGLGLRVSATAAEVAAAGGALSLGSVSYRTGIASLLRSSIEAASGASGFLTTGKTSRASQMRRADQEVTRLERQVDSVTARLQAQYALLERTITSMRSAIPSWPVA